MQLNCSRLRLAAVALAAVSLLGACSSPGPRDPIELAPFVKTVDIERVWTVDLGANETGLLMPVVTETGVYAAGADGLFRIEAQTGRVLWKVKPAARISAGVGSDGHIVAAGTNTGFLVVYDETGRELWTTKLSGDMITPPLVGSGLVIVRTSDTRISCYDALSGERRWRYQAHAPALSLRVAREMRFSPAGVLIGQTNGKLLALDSAGSPVFEIPVAEPKGTTEVDRLVDVVGAPLVDASLMCASAYQGNVLCLSARNGRQIWSRPIDAVSGPVSDGSRIYVTASDGSIHAFDHDSGTPSWVSKEFLWRTPSAVSVLPDAIAVGDFDGVVSVLDPETGKTIGRTEISGAVKSAPVPMAGGALFQTDEGRLVFVKAAKVGKE